MIHPKWFSRNIPTLLTLLHVGEKRACSVTGHILSAGFSRKVSSVGTLLLCKICLSFLGMVWYYQKIRTAMTRFVKIGKVCFCCGNPLSKVNKILFCDCLNKLIVSFTTVPDSHKCPDHHALPYCAQTAHFFCRKYEILTVFTKGYLHWKVSRMF